MKKLALLLVLILAGIAGAYPTVPFGDTVIVAGSFGDSVNSCSCSVMLGGKATAEATYLCTLATAGRYRATNRWFYIRPVKDNAIFQRGRTYTITCKGFKSPDTLGGEYVVLIDSLDTDQLDSLQNLATTTQFFGFTLPNRIYNPYFEIDNALTDAVPTYWASVHGSHYGTRTTAKSTGDFGAYLACHTSTDTTAIRTNFFPLVANTWLDYGVWWANPVGGSRVVVRVKNSAGVKVDSFSGAGIDMLPKAGFYHNLTTGYYYLEVFTAPPTSPFVACTTWLDNVFAQIKIGLDTAAVARAPWNDLLIVQGSRTVAPVTVSGTVQLAPGEYTQIGDSTWLRVFDIAPPAGTYADSATDWGGGKLWTTAQRDSILAALSNAGIGGKVWLRTFDASAPAGTYGDSASGWGATGGGGGSAVITGSGLYACTLYAWDSANGVAINGITLEAQAVGGTNIDAYNMTTTFGRIVFNLNAGNYYVRGYGLGYTKTSPDTFTMAAAGRDDTVYFVKYDPGNPTLSGLQCRVYGCEYTTSGLPQHNAQVTATLILDGDSAVVYNDTTDTTSVFVRLAGLSMTAKADENGQWYVDLYRSRVIFPDRNYQYLFEAKIGGQVRWRWRGQVPNQSQYRLK